jgi:hypothetical protein
LYASLLGRESNSAATHKVAKINALTKHDVS